MKKILGILALATLVASCNNDTKDAGDDAPQVNVYEGSEQTPSSPDSVKADSVAAATPTFDADAGVADNIVNCDNSKYTIRIDRMNNNNIRYTCWNKPKTPSETPSLELDNGKLKDEGSWGRAYSFSNNGWEYQVTDYTPAGDPTINVILKQGGSLKENIILKSQK